MSLLQMSISAAVMISIITVIRAISINRLPKKTFIALWGIVLVRLLVPFSWPSPLSVYSLANRPEVGQIGGAPVTNVLPIVPTSTAPTDALTAGFRHGRGYGALDWRYAFCTLQLPISDAAGSL